MLLFLCGCFRAGGNRDMKSEDLPKSVSKAIDILLNYEEHTIDELKKGLIIIREYERPKYTEGWGPSDDKGRGFLHAEFRFDKLGIIIYQYSEGPNQKITAERVNKDSNDN